MSAEELNKKTVPELKALAKEAGIKGFDGLKKAELVEALIAPAGAQPSAQEEIKSSSEKSDYASHPKFDKFKSIQGAE